MSLKITEPYKYFDSQKSSSDKVELKYSMEDERYAKDKLMIYHSDSNSHANISEHMALSSPATDIPVDQAISEIFSGLSTNSFSDDGIIIQNTNVKNDKLSSFTFDGKVLEEDQDEEEIGNDNEEKITEQEEQAYGQKIYDDDDENLLISSDDYSELDDDDEDFSDSDNDGDSDEDDSEDSYQSSDMEEQDPWIDWFLGLPGHHLLLKVNEEFIEDEFNLTDLSSVVPYYKYALDMIFDVDHNRNQSDDSPSLKVVRHSAKLLYTLIHARFILCKQGMIQLAERYEKGYFGCCPRYYCNRFHVIPIGLSDVPLQARIQVYCPSCDDVYQLPPLYHRVDGASFGSSFTHIFFKSFPSLTSTDMLPPLKIYEPRIYGFKLHHGSAIDDDKINAEIHKRDGTSKSTMAPTKSSVVPFRGYIANPLDMSWLRKKPNYHR